MLGRRTDERPASSTTNFPTELEEESENNMICDEGGLAWTSTVIGAKKQREMGEGSECA